MPGAGRAPFVRSAALLFAGLLIGLAGVAMLLIGRSARRRALLRAQAATPIRVST